MIQDSSREATSGSMTCLWASSVYFTEVEVVITENGVEETNVAKFYNSSDVYIDEQVFPMICSCLWRTGLRADVLQRVLSLTAVPPQVPRNTVRGTLVRWKSV